MMRKIISVLCSVIFLAGTAFAGNIDTFGIGAKASALGGAYGAYANDPYAAYYNPAGLTQINKKVVSMGTMAAAPDVSIYNYTVKATSSTPQMGPVNYHDTTVVALSPHLGFAMPINDKLAFGVASYAPFGFHLEFNKKFDPVNNPSAFNSYEDKIARVVLTPTIAYKVNNKLSVGFGLSLGKSDELTKLHNYSLYLLTANAFGAANAITSSLEYEGKDNFNYSFNLGLMYKPVETVSLGLTYRSQTDCDYKDDSTLTLTNLSATEKAMLNGLLSSPTGGGALGGKALTKYTFDVSESDVDFPDQIQLGVKYQPKENLSMEADMVWTRWSMVKHQTLNYDDPALQNFLGTLASIASVAQGGGPVAAPTSKVVERDWVDTRQLRFGIEWKASDLLTMRGGYFYDPSPIPDTTFDTIWLDSDKKTYSLGCGVNLNPWTIDAVIQYTTTEMKRYIGGESENLNETYNGAEVIAEGAASIWGGGLTVAYAF